MSAPTPNISTNVNELNPDHIPRLHVSKNPSSTWYSQKGGKNNRIPIRLELRGKIPLDVYTLISESDKVPISWSVLKEDGTVVPDGAKHNFAVFSVAENPNVMLPSLSMSLSSATVDLYFRYTCISKNAGGSLRLLFKVGQFYSAVTSHTTVLTKQNNGRTRQRQRAASLKRSMVVPTSVSSSNADIKMARVPPRKSNFNSDISSISSDSDMSRSSSSKKQKFCAQEDGSDENDEEQSDAGAECKRVKRESMAAPAPLQSRMPVTGLELRPHQQQQQQQHQQYGRSRTKKVSRRELLQRVLATEERYIDLHFDHEQLKGEVAQMKNMIQKLVGGGVVVSGLQGSGGCVNDTSDLGYCGAEFSGQRCVSPVPMTMMPDYCGAGSDIAAEQSWANSSFADKNSVCGSVIGDDARVVSSWIVKNERYMNATKSIADEDDDREEEESKAGCETDSIACLESFNIDGSVLLCPSPMAGDFLDSFSPNNRV